VEGEDEAAYFRVISLHSPDDTRKNYEKISG
jgi:hypothetical protein